MHKWLLFIFLSAIWSVSPMVAGCGSSREEENPTSPADDTSPPVNDPVALADSNLEAAIRTGLDGVDGGITLDAALSMTKLEARGRGIGDLTGIEQLRNLAVVDLADNQIEDISALSSLKKLTFLDLGNNRVSDLAPLSGLARLQILALDYNAIEDISALLAVPALVSAELTGNPLDNLGGDNESPAWSPDGSKIAFVRATSTSFKHIYLVNPDGGDLVQLIDSKWEELEPAWSPDGTRIAFVSKRQSGKQQIFLMDADGSNVTQLTDENTLKPFIENLHDARHPSWSPDGTEIIFAVGYNRLFIINADDGNIVPFAVRGGFPSWLADGITLLFVNENSVFVKNVKSGEGVNLTGILGRNGLLRSLDKRDPTWTPTDW